MPSASFATQIAVANFATKAVIFGGLSMAASAATMALMQPKTGAGGSPIAFKADPAAPIGGVMGRSGVGGRQVHANVWGKGNLFLSYVTVLSLGPIQSIEQFKANDTVVTFPGSQGLAANVEPYKDKMWMTYRLGLPGDAALGPPTGQPQGSPGMTEWTSAHKLPQFAHAFWTMRNNSKNASYEGGVPRPLWTIHGMKLWDPRKDSTYPGGSGSQRRDDWRTWAYTENPHLHALAWVRGHFKLNTDGSIDRTKHIAGVGAPDDAIDIAAFVSGANIADENEWVISGEWTTADDKWQVLVAMLQAGSAEPINRGAQISIRTNTPVASIHTLTAEEVVGSVQLATMVSRRDRFNTIIPRFRSEPHKWEQLAAGPVTSSVYVTEDGGEKRSREVAYNYVRSAQQVAQLAAYDLANSRESLTGTIPCKPHLLGLKVGDALTANLPEAGLNGQKFVVTRRNFDPQSCVVTLEVRSESDGKHDWALGQEGDPPAAPSLTAIDPIPPAPEEGEWTITPQAPTSGGISQPGLEVVGELPDGMVAMLVEVGPDDEGPWRQVYHGPAQSEAIRITGLNPGEVYYVAISYFAANGHQSARMIQGPYTAPALTAGDVIPTAPSIVALEGDIEDLFGVTETLNGDLSAAELLLGSVSSEVAAARGGQSNLNARIAQVNQARIDGDSTNASAISAVALEVENARDGEASLLAKIATVETAVVDESTARSTAIGVVEAKLVPPVNEYANADLSNGTVGFAPLWGYSGPLPTVTSDGSEIRVLKAGGDWDGTNTYYCIVGLYGGPDTVAITGGSRVCWPVATGERVGFAVDARTRTGDARWSFSLLWCDVDGDNITSLGTAVTAYGEDEWQRRGIIGTVPGEGFVWVEGAATLGWDGSLGVADMALRRPTFARLAATATTLPAYTAPANGRQIGELSASVREQGLALIDVETKQALAYYEVVAAATGGKPARLKLVSGSLGSAVALDYDQLYLGDNTVVDDATDTEQTTIGSNIRVIAKGAPFGAAGNLIDWYGPTGIALSAMTPANGYFGFMTTSPYVFNNAVADGVATLSVTALGSSSGTTNVTMTSGSLSVKLSPRVKISAVISYDGGSQMTGGVTGTFAVEVFEQNSAGTTVIASTTMTVNGINGGAVNDLTGGQINTFPIGQMAGKSGNVTYGIRVRRTSGAANFINLRATLYLEVI
ncbi:hypothetical protein [uncultured Brevundimonas sp.]|uniref:hypothetical protein n=1 Tax=uncultured Brevundimonas sp. TaxID=213418 RepID=UPI002623F68E|nr:hypothetical protein [uncultured Brevundimonas sp.]